MTPSYGVVLLTMGTRPAELARGLQSLLRQRDVALDVLVVGNGWAPTGLPAGVRALALPENVGIPAGRNAGAAQVSGDLLFFLDDDAFLADDDTLARLAARFAAHPRLGLLQPRVTDPDTGETPRRWVPRLRVGDPLESGPALALWEGAVATRRALFDQVGGWPGEFFYGHEGIDLVWRVWDAGAFAWYAGDVVVHHEANDPARFDDFYRLNARNRVWLARRNLPWVLAVPYVATWTVATVLRLRGQPALRVWFGGLREGIGPGAGRRRPMRWRTVWRLTRAGRPPVV